MADNSSSSSKEASELEWIRVQKDIAASRIEENKPKKTKLQRKMKENPLVPIGCLITATVLLFGLRSFIKGNRVMSQRMMRLRVLAQGTTVGALMLGVLLSGRQSKG